MRMSFVIPVISSTCVEPFIVVPFILTRTCDYVAYPGMSRRYEDLGLKEAKTTGRREGYEHFHFYLSFP